MDEALLEAFRATNYLVCLDETEWASIRIDQPLPPLLQALVGTCSWGFITAWNPRAQPRAEADNTAALHEMLTVLRGWPGTLIRAGIGVGASGWTEPSLFVTGPDHAMLDALARQYGQLAYLHGQADGCARLRLMPS
jgi:hypothetical protein